MRETIRPIRMVYGMAHPGRWLRGPAATEAACNPPLLSIDVNSVLRSVKGKLQFGAASHVFLIASGCSDTTSAMLQRSGRCSSVRFQSAL
jgi:hypothetical protein